MTAIKSCAQVGDRCWRVEWLAKFATDENGDHDYDADVYSVRRVSTYEQAQTIARDVFHVAELQGDPLVEICHEEFVPYDESHADLYPHAGYWEHIGSSIYFNGDEFEES